MNKKPGEELNVPTRRQANRVARMIGCEGSHQDENGMWLPCSSSEGLAKIIGKTKSYPAANFEKVKKQRKRKGRSRDGYEKLRERGVMGIETLSDGSLVSARIAGKSAARKARRDRLAATPALRSERIRGSKRNSIGSASSRNSAKNVFIDEATRNSLEAKIKEHNQRVKDKEPWRRASLGQLKAVYRRGAGAFSVSHRPGMTRNQWAMGRVNAFLKILSSGKPENRRYVGDNDLLPDKHPWKKTIGTKSLYVKRLRIGKIGKGKRRLGIGGAVREAEQMIPDARDADGDGNVQDGTRFERPFRRVFQAVASVIPGSKTRKRKQHEKLNPRGILDRLNDPDSGFTIKMGPNTDAKSGWAIARNGKGLAVPARAIYDEDGNVTDLGRRVFLAYVERHKADLLGKDDEDSGMSVHIGGWHNPADGMIYFDVTDVYDKKKFSKDDAMSIGAREKQISIADLDEITAAIEDGDWGGHTTTIETGGDGGDVIDIKDFEAEFKKLDEIYGPIDRSSLYRLVEKGPEKSND